MALDTRTVKLDPEADGARCACVINVYNVIFYFHKMRLQSNLFLILFTLNVYNIYVKRTPSVTYRLIRKLTCFAELRNEHTFFDFIATRNSTKQS